MSIQEELKRYREKKEKVKEELKMRGKKWDEHEKQEKEKMKGFLEALQKMGIEATGETNGYWAHLVTHAWVIHSIDQETRGFVTSYRNLDTLPFLSPEDKKTLKEMLDHHEFKIERGMFPAIKELLQFTDYKTSGGSAVFLCQKEHRRLQEKQTVSQVEV